DQERRTSGTAPEPQPKSAIQPEPVTERVSGRIIRLTPPERSLRLDGQPRNRNRHRIRLRRSRSLNLDVISSKFRIHGSRIPSTTTRIQQDQNQAQPNQPQPNVSLVAPLIAESEASKQDPHQRHESKSKVESRPASPIKHRRTRRHRNGQRKRNCLSTWCNRRDWRARLRSKTAGSILWQCTRQTGKRNCPSVPARILIQQQRIGSRLSRRNSLWRRLSRSRRLDDRHRRRSNRIRCLLRVSRDVNRCRRWHAVRRSVKTRSVDGSIGGVAARYS